MRIGTLAARTGVSTRMLRYYEEQGLLTSRRGANGYREFGEADVERVRSVRSLIASGLPTRLVAVVLGVEGAGEATRAGCTTELAELLTGELARLDDRIACLSLSRETVRDFLSCAARHPTAAAR